MTTPIGWAPDEALLQAMLAQGYDPTGNNFSTYSSYAPLTLPQQYWPDPKVYERTSAQMRDYGITPAPIGTLDPTATAELGNALYTSPSRLDDPAFIAAVMMGGAAAGGAFANGGAGYGAGLSEITLPSSVAPISPAGLTAGPAAGSFGPLTGNGVLLPSGATIATSGLGAANAAASAAGGGGAASGGAAAGGAVAEGLNWTTLVPSLVSGLTGIAGANAQSDAAKEAVALSERMFNTAREDALPRIQTGNRAVGALDDLMGLTTGTPNMARFTQSPDYQFNLAEGQKAIDRSLASRGKALSGQGVKEGVRYASGMASNQYGSFVDRLLATAGLGTTGAAASAAAGANNASIGGNAIQNAGAARSSGYGAVNDAVQGGISNHLLQQYLNRYPVRP